MQPVSEISPYLVFLVDGTRAYSKFGFAAQQKMKLPVVFPKKKEWFQS